MGTNKSIVNVKSEKDFECHTFKRELSAITKLIQHVDLQCMWQSVTSP
jgi:hypothetical protein